MTESISFFAPGIPKPGGSKTAFYNKKLGRSLIVDASDNRDWKNTVRFAGREAMKGRAPFDGVISVKVIFEMPRIKGHYRPNGELRRSAPFYHTVKPDATKLWRSTEDALTGICWRDDAQIAEQEIVKRYGDAPGAIIVVVQREVG